MFLQVYEHDGDTYYRISSSKGSAGNVSFGQGNRKSVHQITGPLKQKLENLQRILSEEPEVEEKETESKEAFSTTIRTLAKTLKG